ncbi:hypothetical protein CcaverHIS002_0308630 [Cutaneotrichosporon cavernicola]|uniref:Anaphase-promoting complex subunit 1 n=1 Tax=Cutaneotrichosporon cavernicola TaxID=279322 RepID=A0AA48I6T7_9TREE|nr:uncharacterized protein CcaverHIS019_0308490 [Cutaneotrichosporon cavernicola]BEI82995.1 hypothetical protein CcaverHIS002_0308630 [Cutaneotrichosporon cavernicola]BEI90779.1 hypothetical protein CcaverHIS019_0308490 [Cutaneotrichosporon cavernicola]BEI98558.1 hypothetical protein CcaverHIS631_0308570 [Cutaneotrichosporon cavernicola]BEJ06329.1 hypothetical protein CcaverHIS641_0308510 [Cutaneotrichosporon cavernicola]
MLQATVLGTGTSAATTFYTQSDSPARSFLAQPRSLDPSSKPSGRYDGTSYGDERLTWSGPEVTWTRGVELIRRFNYSYLGQDVSCATLAWFHTPEEAWVASNPHGGEARPTPKSRPAEGTFGPFHTSADARWMARTKRAHRPQVGLQRAVVVVLQRQMVVHLATGEKHFRYLSFPVESIWALPSGGVFLQRRVERLRTTPRLSLDGDTSLDSLSLKLEANKGRDAESPRLFSVTGMWDEPLKVGEAVLDGQRLVGQPSYLKASVTVLLVTPDPYPLVVAWDADESKVVVFRYTTVMEEVEDDAVDRRASTATRLRPHELMKQANARRGRPSGVGRRSSAAATELFERPRRRSRLSEEPFPPPDVPGAFSTRLSFGGGHEPKLRRVSTASMMREDINPFGDRDRVLDIVAEDLFDTTMVHGLGGEKQLNNRRSDIVMDRIWGWRPPTSIINPATIRVFLSENRSSASVFLNVLIPAANGHKGLFIFHVEQARPAHYVFSEVRMVKCLAAAPVLATRAHVYDTLAVDLEGAAWILTPSGGKLSVTIPQVPADLDVANQFASRLGLAVGPLRLVDLVEPSGMNVTAVYNDGERVRISTDITLPKGLCRRAMEALSYALAPEVYAELFEAYLGRTLGVKSGLEQWRVLADVILSKCGIGAAAPTPVTTDPTLLRLARRLGRKPPTMAEPQSVGPAACAPEIILALHLVAQDCRLASTTEPDLLLIAPVLAQLTAAVGRRDWLDYWARLMPSSIEGVRFSTPPTAIDTSLLDLFPEPPDVVSYLSRSTVMKTCPFPIPQSAFTHSSPLGSVRPCLQTERITEIYSRLSPGMTGSSIGSACQQRGLAVIHYMLDNGLDEKWFADVPFGVAMPAAELFRIVQQHPPVDASPAVYSFIGRTDLTMLSSTKSFSILELPMGAEEDDEKKTIGNIMKSVHHPGAKHAHFSALPHVRFGSDKRKEEVERIMQTTQTRTVPIEDPKGLNEQDIQTNYQNYVNMLAQRTFAVTVGQGMWQFASRSAPMGSTWHIPPFDLSVKIVPANQVMHPQIAEGVEWPHFHHAVAAALSISPDSKGIDASWVLYNRPSTINAEHGGFLLGLGLTGHLRKFGSKETFAYLHLRHEKTTVGTLLGMAASFAGSQDPMVTSQISLHSNALLPPGAMELNGSPLVQSTALLSIGLVYAGSKHLHMADTTLREISRTQMAGVDSFTENREAYSFSASMGFGLVMLGRGGKTPSAVENEMLQELMRCIYGNAPDVKYDAASRKGPHVDPTETSPGATLALGLMYLRTGRKDVADMLEIPQTELSLESVRPDQLLIRTYARAMIMWDDIRGTVDWVNAQLPSFIDHNVHKLTYGLLDLNTELAYFNIVAGACLAIGVRFAGRPPETAHTVLMNFFAVLGKAAAGQSMTYEARIRRNASRQALNTVTLALATLMSGTGELNVMRRLRVSHGQEGVGVTYGSHMAMHMALGLLFLGKGYYSLGNSNIAIAGLSIAFFPRFLSNVNDNRAYPQLFRHLWALAVEPRCLICRDVDTRETITLPIKIKLKGRREPQGHISPTPVAPFSSLDTIYVDSVRYWPIRYDLSKPRYRDHLVRTRTIWVKRRAAFLDYAADPKGYRSLFVRTGVTSSYDMHHDFLSAASPLYPEPEALSDLFAAHSNDVAVHAVGRWFTGPSTLEKFIRNVMFECVALDKGALFPVYVGIYLALAGDDGLRLARAAQVAFLIRFYRPTVFDKDYANHTPGERRHPILRQTFLHALKRRLTVPRPDDAWAYFDSGEWPSTKAETLALYLAGRYVPPVRMLQALRGLVSNSSGAERDMLEFKARAVADKYAALVAAQYDEGEGAADVPQWKLDSVQDVVGMYAA